MPIVVASALREGCNMHSPCKDCENRHVGCHSVCPKYREFNQKCIEVREKRLKENDINSMCIEQIQKITKLKRRERRK